MAPPTPVFDRFEIWSKYHDQLTGPESNCQLKSITQNECTFKIPNPGLKPQAICVPFKRIFQRCLVTTTNVVNGKKTKGQKWINIEITDDLTNQALLKDPNYEITVKDFLQAEKETRHMLEMESGI